MNKNNINTSLCSNGTRITHATAMRRYTEALRTKHQDNPPGCCEACQERQAIHNDHTIAKARCKQIGKTELIYDPANFVDSCETCHRQWEAFKDGAWLLHKNCVQRLVYLREHDPDGYQRRIQLTDLNLRREMEKNIETFKAAVV